MKTVLLWFAFGACVCMVLLFLVFFSIQNNESAKTSPIPSQIPIQPNNSQSHASPVTVPEPSAKALNHYRSGMALIGIIILWSLLIPALFLFTGLSARMRSWAERLGRRWYSTFALYCIAFCLLYYLVSLPLSYYAGFIHPHNYDLSNQTLGRWLGNYFKGAAVTMVMGLAVGWIPFFLIKKSPRRWWLYLGLLAAPLLCVQLLIQPIFIDPLFHKFQPLQDNALESKILAQAARVGIEGSRVYEVNMSVDTKGENAYVTGFMGAKRIVLWDTTLKNLDEDELVFILGHEMGHYVLGHIIKLIVFESVLILISLYVAYLLAGPVIARFKKSWGFNVPWDFAALPLGILAVWIFALADMPIYMAFSRHVEHEADRFGLELTHNNHAAATAFVKMQQNNLAIPRPGRIFQFWFGSHPTPAERIEFCNSYRPWESGQPSLYGEYIKQ
jgi:Zn-dependent protease with chaperone function